MEIFIELLKKVGGLLLISLVVFVFFLWFFDAIFRDFHERATGEKLTPVLIEMCHEQFESCPFPKEDRDQNKSRGK